MSTEVTGTTTGRVPDAPAGTGAQLLLARLRQRTGGSRPGGATPDDGAIPRVARDVPAPLSFAQRRMWVLDRLRPDGIDYLVPLVLRLRGDLSRIDLAGALDRLVQRHEILRTRYGTDGDGEPVQTIDPAAAVALGVDDLTGAEPALLDAVLSEEAARPIDLATGPVLRARLLRLGPGEHVLVLIVHHIAVDGWSGSILTRELAALCTGADLAEPELSYADVAAWQHRQADEPAAARSLAYWTSHLHGLPVLELTTDHPRPAVWDGRGGSVPFQVPAGVARGVAALAARHRATPFMVYLTALWAVLHRYTGQTDFAVGTPIAGRTRAETHDIVGLFVNLLVLRADVTGEPTFAQLLERARHTAIDAYAHQDTPFERIVDALAPGRDLAGHPLVNVNLTLQNTEAMRFTAGPVVGEEVAVPVLRAKFDLGWTLQERPDGSVAGTATVAHALFDAETAGRMAGHFLRLLAAAVADPDRPVGDLALMDAAELAGLIDRPVTPAATGPRLDQRFAAQARRRPDAVAVTVDGRHVGYGELDARANRLAHRLRELGVGRGDLVGICLRRGLDTVVAILAVVKAGGAYLPLDPDHPAERTDFLVRDARARVVLSEGATRGRLSTVDAGTTVLSLDDPAHLSHLATLPTGPPDICGSPDDLAYVIYTSGSTGQPKGVQVTHANVVRLFTSTEVDFGFGADDVWALFHSFAFDFSVWEMWGALLYGGRLVVVPYGVSRSPWDVVTLLADEGVTVLNQTPSAFRSLVEMAGRGDPALDRLRLRWVVFGGEALDVASLEPWWDRFGDTAPRLVNMYGITETTVHVTYRPVGRADLGGDRSPLGRPLPDLTMYVLDDRMRPAPVGVPGELYVGGAGVARGYLGRPALTAARFVPDPFGPAGARLYRTGDRARPLPGGDVGFLGRLDDQVKIRGFRIELGEVQACLAAHPDLDTALVVVHEPAPGDRRLAGYLVPRAGAQVRVPDVRAYAAARLPAYMVPASLTVLPGLPLTASGKADRRALPAPDGTRPDQDHAYVAPRNPAEHAMAGVWADVLGTDRVGVHDNFFALGGDSIRAVRLVGLLRTHGFGYAVQDLFRQQSIAGLVGSATGGLLASEGTGTPPFAHLSEADRARVPDAVVDAYPMTRVQAGMVYELLADVDRNLYHNVTSYLIRDTGPFDRPALATAAAALVDAHEILRTSFDLAGFAEPLQLVHDRARVECGHTDLRGLAVDRQDERMAAFREAQRDRVFDLSAAPLMRLHTHQIAEDRWYLSITECHAILDGWSHNSLISELLDRYRTARAGGPQPAPDTGGVRYADYVAQEQRSLRDPADRAFWAGRLGASGRLALPATWGRPDDGTSYAIHVPFRDVEPQLRTLAARAGASLKSVLIAAHVAVWRSATAASGPFHFGLVSNGRTEVAGGDRVRGMFLNPVPFVAPQGPGSWRDLVRAVFAEEVELWPHRRYPLPELQREFGAGGRLLEVAFNYLDFHVLDREMVDTAGSTDVSPNEFPLAALVQGGDVIITVRSAWVRRDRAEILAEMYRDVLTTMAADPDGPARAVLPPAERQRLVARGAGPTVDRPADGVHEAVLRHAAHTADAVAVDAPGGRLTYGDLRERALVWAAALHRSGVRTGDLVGLCLPRGPELVCAQLGILAAGAAYVPVDPGHPAQRIAELLDDAAVRATVAGSPVGGRAPVLTPADVPAAAGDPAPVPAADPEHLAYVVHTSGSTGRPKGVMVRHAALVDRVVSMRHNVGLTEHDVVVAIVPTVTDVAQLATFAALTAGARLVLADDDLARDPQSLAALLAESGATLMQASPTTWRMLLESGWHPPARFRALCGGEAMDDDLRRRLCGTPAQVWDMYGPTEGTVFSFGTRLGADGTSGVWTSAANTSTYLLDEAGEPVLDGVPGQIFVGGSGLARGYLGRPRTTADVFRPDPFAAEPGSRMYATGDVGRRHVDGRVEILGRTDHQVKVRGFRVELGEVENAVVTHPGVRAAVAHPVPDRQGETRLAAYVVPGDPGVTVDDLRRFLARTLPAHLVPTHLMVLDEFPRLANGKVDRARLPAPDPVRPELTTPYAAPVGPAEAAIAGIWADVLGIERVGRDDDFFALGGHSLLTLRIIARLPREHGIRVSFRDLLEHRTVRELARAVAAQDGTRPPALVWLGERGDGAPLFCVHPGGGSAHWYRHLAEEYAPHRPLAAFEWPGLHGDTEVAGSVPEIAGVYVAELRAARPAGPYHLLGWCGSSGIAWEMARRLRAEGERVRLVLIDPFEYETAGVNPILANLEVLRRAEELLAALRGGADSGGTRDEQLAELLTVLREVTDDGDGLTAADVAVDDTWAHRLRAWRQMLELRSSYRFTTYQGAVDLVVCAELAGERYETVLGRTFEQYLRQWRGLAAGGVRVHEVPGDHRTALLPPHVSRLATTVAAIVDNEE